MSVRRAARSTRIPVVMVLLLGILPMVSPVRAAVIAGTAPAMYVDEVPLTRNPSVELIIQPVFGDPGGVVVGRIAANDPTTEDGVLADGVAVDEVTDWALAAGPDGPRTVYGQLQYASGAWSPIASIDVELDAEPATTAYFDIDPSAVFHDVSSSAAAPAWWIRSSTPDDRIYGSGTPSGEQPRTFAVAGPEWTFTFQHYGNPIMAGTYEVEPDIPCMDSCAEIRLSPGRDCLGSGEVTIHQIAFTTTGDLRSVSADFRMDCSVYGLMSGSIRYGSTQPIHGLSQAPAALDPGFVGVGDSTDTTVTFTNFGTVPTTLGEAGFAGEHPGDYAVADEDCDGVTLAVGASCAVEVRFAPTSFGYRYATLQVPDETARGSRQVRLRGLGTVETDLTLHVDVPDPGPGLADVTIVVTPGTVDPSLVLLSRDGSQMSGSGRVVTVKTDPSRIEITQRIAVTPGQHEFRVTYEAHDFHLAADPVVVDVTVPDEGVPWGWLAISEGAATTSRTVHLHALLDFEGLGIDKMATSNDGVTWTEWNATQLHGYAWLLTAGGGTKTVYAKWHEQQTDQWSPIVTDTIVLESNPPTATAPRRGFNAGVPLSNGAIPTRIPWSGSDAESSVARYELAQQTDGGAWTTVSTTLTSPTATRALATERTYRFRVRAVDMAGNVGSWAYGGTFRVSRFSEGNSRITYGGTWSTSKSAVFWGGLAMASNKAGARASITFTGRSVAWVASRGPTRGKADVLVNGVKVATVDLYSATAKHQQVVWAGSWTAAASRTITIRVQETSGRPRVDLDAFVTAD